MPHRLTEFTWQNNRVQLCLVMHFEPHEKGEVGPLGKRVVGKRLIERLPALQPAPTYVRRLHEEAGSRLGARQDGLC